MNRYQLTDLVDDRNRALLAEVRSRAGLILVDADCWGVECRAGRVTIGCAPSPYPVASFTHQLLQAQYEFMGLQRGPLAVVLLGARHDLVGAVREVAPGWELVTVTTKAVQAALGK